VLSRLAGVVFFTFEPAYRLFMYFDMTFLIPEAVLLTMAVRAVRTGAGAAATMSTV
jgi:hypothetical protein